MAMLPEHDRRRFTVEHDQLEATNFFPQSKHKIFRLGFPQTLVLAHPPHVYLVLLDLFSVGSRMLVSNSVSALANGFRCGPPG